jgi:acetyl-CoA acetyltransferase
VRPLPQLTPANEWFWTSGADGRLRISWIKALGFCGIGEAKDWLDGGRRIAPDGELPVNPHGGQLSEGRTHGFGFIYEAMAQLRHEAGERQVPGARTAVVTSGGGTASGVLLLRGGEA